MKKHTEQPQRSLLQKIFSPSIRGKLIAIFTVIKVLPLIALALFAAKQLSFLGDTVKKRSDEMVTETRSLVNQIGTLASDSSIVALDLKSRESIERLTTDTAKDVAHFLYDRDKDILIVAKMAVEKNKYEDFLRIRQRDVVYHNTWQLNEDKTRWIPADPPHADKPHVNARAEDNKKDFHYIHPPSLTNTKTQPLYHELTFLDLNGQEKIKISQTDLLTKQLLDVSKKENTWCKAEDYFQHATQLKKNEIYVSTVIGPYLFSDLIGPYTPQRTIEKDIVFAPEKSGYAGKENPVGKRFQGIIRWVTPVYENDERVGYITLALDHTHLMEFTDHLIPTEERYSDISDAGSGNYAFMWDFEGRNISHPRDYFIVGYDPETGEQSVPWLSQELYNMWSQQNSFSDFIEIAPRFQNQSLEHAPSTELTRQGQLGLDCRYLNFAPQCTGWFTLTEHGGSGSFVIFWSNLWKLTTAAAIPYHTGIYKNSPRGFGFITIGANVDEFHSSATQTAAQINNITQEYEQDLDIKRQDILSNIDSLLAKTVKDLTISTSVMIVLVIFIAIWMASVLTSKITTIIGGIRKFQQGDLSARLKVETKDELGKLTSAFNEMSDNIEQSISALDQSRKRAEESDKAKSLFLANMSHEIRTPMNAIIGMNRLALESAEDSEQKKLLEIVKASASSLLAVINDILDFSKIEAGQLDIENHPFSLHEVIDSVMRTITVLAEEKGVETTYNIRDDIPKYVSGDSMRLRQILLNLLGNSVKFTSRGLIGLDVSLLPSKENKFLLSFTVHDTGIGIPKKHLNIIFDRFSQSDLSISRKYQGSGLGLAISKKLCQLMGGNISVISEQGVGSSFTFTILFNQPELSDHSNTGNSLSKHGEMKPLEILLVEDNQANRQLAQMVLEQGNHKITTAENGFEALQQLCISSFDVILMDVQMPEMDGFTATRIIRQAEAGTAFELHLDAELEASLRSNLHNSRQIIIAITAHAMRGDKAKCLNSGMDDYLTKPFMPDQVEMAMKKLFQPSSKNEHNIQKYTTEPSATEHTSSLSKQAALNLSQQYGLDEKDVATLLNNTKVSIASAYTSLKDSLEKEALDEAANYAHTLKGIFLNLHLDRETSIIEKLKYGIDNQRKDLILESCNKLESSLESFLH